MVYLPRLALVGVAFLISAVAGLLLTLVRPFHPDNSRLCARLYAWPILRLLGIRMEVDVDTLDALRQSCVVIANHQSNLDLFILGSVVPRRTVSVGKKSLKWIPLFGQAYWLAGNILVDRGNPRSAKHAMRVTHAALKERDTSIWVFPEGTRSLGRGLQPFKKGAFQMAVAAGVPIVPVCASSYVGRLHFGRWGSGRVRIQSLPPIPTEGLSARDVPALMERCQASMSACIERLDTQASPRGWAEPA